jgi:hypothetical protein
MAEDLFLLVRLSVGQPRNAEEWAQKQKGRELGYISRTCESPGTLFAGPVMTASRAVYSRRRNGGGIRIFSDFILKIRASALIYGFW